MVEIQKQIDSLREAFSADTSQPFELRANFPYGTPKKSSETNTPTDATFAKDAMSTANQVVQSAYPEMIYGTPTSAGLMNQTAAAQSLMMLDPGHNEMETMQMNQQAPQWNPTRIFE